MTTSYITITDAETDPDAPLTSALAKKWRDNPIAIAEGAIGAPRVSGAAVAYGWELPAKTITASSANRIDLAFDIVNPTWRAITTTDTVMSRAVAGNISGSVYCKAEFYKSGSTVGTAYLSLYKNGVLVQTWTATTATVVTAIVSSISVSSGDVFEWYGRVSVSGVRCDLSDVGYYSDLSILSALPHIWSDEKRTIQ